jgi:hypothetical protein
MSIFSRWDNAQKTVMHLVFEKGWTRQDYQQAAYEIEIMLSGVNAPVHMIFDIRSAPTLPSGSALAEIMRDFSSTPSRVGLVVVVGAGNVLQMMLRTGQKLSSGATTHHIRFATDLDDAHQILNSVMYVSQSLRDPMFAERSHYR